jgi:hypothetical protein
MVSAGCAYKLAADSPSTGSGQAGSKQPPLTPALSPQRVERGLPNQPIRQNQNIE